MRLCVAITGPSGSGKTEITKGLLAKIEGSTRSISTTTRERREDEKNGRDYYFVSHEEFENSIENGEFLEYEQNYDKYYGTSRIRLEEAMIHHRVVFISNGVDTKGARSIKKMMPNAITIFILPDSLETLRPRLEKRKSKDNIEVRLAQAQEKIDQADDFDYQVINRDGHIEETIEQILEIINANLAIHV